MILLDIRFLGGAGEVGRSGFLLEGSKNILLDYGIKLDRKTEYPEQADRVDAVVISHAHLDHSGYTPTLYNSAFPAAFGTLPTRDLSELLINDSIKINRLQKTGQRFVKRELRELVNNYIPCNYRNPVEFGEYSVTLHDAGHISGSAITEIEDRKGRVLAYTGDFKPEPQTLHHGAELVKCDVLITESTYAMKDHPDRTQLRRKFIDHVKDVMDSNGVALVPVFAVGRAQEMLAMLQEEGLADRVFLDGMAKAATEIVMDYHGFVDNPQVLQKAMSNARWIQTPRDRSHALGGGTIILTTAGMLNGGPVLNYITKLNRNSHIFLTGYQAEGTNGRNLIEGRPLEIDEGTVRIKTPFSFYDFSAHAGRTDLFNYIRKAEPETVICVHGDKDNSEKMSEELKLEGFDAHAPKIGERMSIEF